VCGELVRRFVLAVRHAKLENYLALSSDRKQRFAVLYVIPPGFDRPVGRELRQAVNTGIIISAINLKAPIVARHARTKAARNL
jgi:hypothetical protein